MKVTTRWTRAVAEALFADENGPPPAERLDWLCRDFEDFVEHAGPRSELIFGAALTIATWAAPLAIGRRPPLERLSLEDRCVALERTEATAAGLPMLALKAMLCFMYFEHPDARADIGVDDGCPGSDS
jgi:hypothetical protein